MNKRAKQISTLGSRATALVSVCLVLFLLGAAALAGLAGHKLRDDARRNIGFTVMMEHECPRTDFDAMKRRLLATPAIETFIYTSAEDILAQESESLGDDIAAMLGANPYSSEFEVRMRPAYANPDSVQVLSERFAEAPGVSSVLCDVNLIAGLDNAINRTGLVLVVLALVLLVVSIALINNTVSLSIYGRRFIIHTMKLVGATGGFIRRPFIISGLGGPCCHAVLYAVGSPECGCPFSVGFRCGDSSGNGGGRSSDMRSDGDVRRQPLPQSIVR